MTHSRVADKLRVDRFADNAASIFETAQTAMQSGHASGDVTILVGPEGGIADDEIAALSEAGATAVRIGPTVLRTSTAAAVALGALGALTPRWR